MPRGLLILLLTLLFIPACYPVLAQDSLNVTQLSELSLCWDGSRQVVIQGDYAYVTSNSTGLRILDISDPENPVEVGYCDTPSGARSVAVSGEYAYVACLNAGLYIMDITDPTDPVIVGNWSGSSFSCNDVAVSGNYAFLAGGQYTSMMVIDVSIPSNPTFAGSYDTYGSARGIAVSGNWVYLAVYGYGLYSVDVSDPNNPVGRSHCYDPEYANDVSVCGNYAYVGTFNGVTIVNISNPLLITAESNIPLDDNVYETAVYGDFAYVCNEHDGLRVFYVADPANPVEVVSASMPGYVLGAAVSGEHCFVCATGLVTLDIHNPAHPFIEGFYKTDTISDIVTSGDYAYVSNRTVGIRIFNISQPETPLEVGFINSPGQALNLAVADDYLYIADCHPGLMIYDVSDPSNPSFSGSINTPGITWDVAVSGDYAYVADTGYGLRIIDISDPAQPCETGSFDPIRGSARGVTVEGDYAFVFFLEDYAYKLFVIDVSDPTDPAMVSFQTIADFGGMMASGEYLYLGNTYGLDIYDISDPANLAHVSFYNTPGNGYNVTVLGDYAYIADGSAGLTILNVSDPSAPSLAGYYDMGGWTYYVAIAGVYALSGNIYNFCIYDCSEATGGDLFSIAGDVSPAEETNLAQTGDDVILRPACPNPFNATTVLNYDLRVPGQVDLAVYDVTGRKVAALAEGWQDAGRHDVRFDAAGLASGIYLVQLKTGTYQSLQKIAYLK